MLKTTVEAENYYPSLLVFGFRLEREWCCLDVLCVDRQFLVYGLCSPNLGIHTQVILIVLFGATGFGLFGAFGDIFGSHSCHKHTCGRPNLFNSRPSEVIGRLFCFILLYQYISTLQSFYLWSHFGIVREFVALCRRTHRWIREAIFSQVAVFDKPLYF